MQFYCIADEVTARGFRLAGIRAHGVSTAEEARAAIHDTVARIDYAVIIITEKVALWVRPEIETIRLGRDCPLIVEIPGPEGPLSERKSLREFVQEAVGMRVS